MPLKTKIFPLFLAVVSILFLNISWAAAQEPLPEDELIVNFANCMSGCRGFEGEIGCEVLCGCTMERFKAVLDRERYMVLNREMEEGVVSPENRIFLDETALMCVAEMDRTLEEMGLIIPDEGELLVPPEGDEGGN